MYLCNPVLRPTMNNNLKQSTQLSPLKQAYLALEKVQAKLEAVKQANREPLAIIGLGCRFPGKADDPETYWEMLRQGIDTIGEVPADRWDIDAYFDSNPDAPGKMSTRWGGFLEHVDQFDPQFFGIAPREAAGMDPQQRLLLEVAWQALEHAGQAPTQLSGSKTGVFVGIINSDYRQLQLEANGISKIDTYYSSGIAQSMAAGRLSYVLGLQGPSVSIDTACSSSLVAIHLACQSLRTGESNMAIAGGVNLILTPELSVAFSKYRMMASDGRCKTFDSRADGFVRGEGCGLIVLKRLSDALADGDNILSVILGTAINQDGPSSGLTAPNGPAQEMLIRDALANANIKPHEVSYVEAHGTGTSLGDPIEVQALGAILGQGRPANNPLAIGSVKTNMGHLEGAAGVAGLIKAALSIHHETIPPHLHLQEPNPFIPWEDLPITIPTALTPWPAEAPRIAGVSAFGFSGTNAHIVLGPAPEPKPVSAEVERPRHLLTLSAKSESALKSLADQMEHYLSTPEAEETLADICFTANTGRTHLSHRLAIIADSVSQAHDKLAAFVASNGEKPVGVTSGPVSGVELPKIAFLFTGQGAQYIEMGRQLYQTQPTFRNTLDKCNELLSPYLELPLLSVLYPELAGSTQSKNPDIKTKIDQTSYTQPALFAIEYALAELWRSWGIQPTVVMGHSVGEYVAACVAGVFSLEDGLKLIAERGRLMQALPAGGEMVAIMADEERVVEAIQPYADQVTIAAINGPRNVVISGVGTIVQQIVNDLAAEGIKSRQLTVSHAFHSPLMEPMLAEFEQVAATVEYSAPRLKLVSNVTGQVARGSSVANAEYWRRHVRESVQFAAAMKTLNRQGIDLFLEIGPSPVLLGMGQRCLPEEAGQMKLWLPSLRKGRDDWQQMFQSLAEMYVYGVDVDWNGFERDYRAARRRLRLPRTPFDRKRYWVDTTSALPKQRVTADTTVHPLLGQRLRSALPQAQFENAISLDTFSFFNDHRVGGVAIMPGAAYMEMGLAIAATLFKTETPLLTDLTIHEPLVATEESWRLVQVVATPSGHNEATFQIFSSDESEQDAAWSLHVEGTVGVLPAADEFPEVDMPLTIQSRCSEEVVATTHYEFLRARGLEFGPSLHGVEQIWHSPNGGEALGKIRLPEALNAEMKGFYLHPALLDACLQILAAAIPDNGQQELFMPIGLDSLQLYRRQFGSQIWSHVQIDLKDNTKVNETYTGSVRLIDETGQVIVEALGLRLKRASQEALLRLAGHNFADWLYQVEWQPHPLPSEALAFQENLSLATVAAQTKPLVQTLFTKDKLAQCQILFPRLNQLSSDYVVYALQQLGWKADLGQRFTTLALAETLHIKKLYRPLLARLLEMLAEDGLLGQEDSTWIVNRIPVELTAETLAKRWTELSSAYPAYEAELTLTGRCGPELANVLTGQADPLQLLFPGGDVSMAEKLYQESPLAPAYNGLVQKAVTEIVAQWPQDRMLRVLEIGGGTGGTTSYVLPQLPAEHTEYTFTDISPLFTAKAAEKFSDYPFVEYRVLDVERDPLTQGFEAHYFDLIVAANVIHATSDLSQTLQYAHRLLTQDGMLLMLEMTAPERWIDLTFGLTEGWWKFTDTNIRPTYPLIDRVAWQRLLQEIGFSEVISLPDALGSGVVDQAMILASKAQAEATRQKNLLVFADKTGTGQQLSDLVSEQGGHCLLVSTGEHYEVVEANHIRLNPAQPEDFRRLFSETSTEWQEVVYLWGLDATPLDVLDEIDLKADESFVCGSALYLVQALVTSGSAATARLWLVTRGAQATGTEMHPLAATQSSLWGLGKVIALEHPELRCSRVDLDPAGDDDSQRLSSEIWLSDREDQITWRQSNRQVARLAKYAPPKRAEEQPRRLEISVRGVLDNLSFQPIERRQPGPDEVEIRVYATGLNFRDVLNALDLYPGDAGPFGNECAGEIVAVGSGVTHLKVGDAVMAAASGSFSTYVTASANLVALKPERVGFEEAATMLIPYLTAYYTLHHLGKMTSGDKVLIHAAAGGVGQAAVQLAKQAGAEIFGTAGSPEKRAFLRSLGVQHVLDSRTLDFADEILELTQGQGVDLVLNSLADEFVLKSVAVLADQGRFLEIGKRGILEPAEMERLRPDASYFIVDWGETNKQDPVLMRTLLLELMALFETGALQPLPRRVFTMPNVVEAFRYMAQAKHIGKIVVTQEGAAAAQASRVTPQAEATYLITGGLGGLGLVVARWLVEKGGRHLVLVGRSQPSAYAQKAIKSIEALGATVLVAQVDISVKDQISNLLADIEATMPPLRGVIHAAGVLNDGVLLHQTWSRFAGVMAPKVEGSWYLHRLTQHMTLDFFVMFSSIASLFGSPGQGNHAAANAFMDALAYFRRAQGLPAISLNWGAWSQVGAAVEHNVAGRIVEQGIGTMTPDEGLQVLDFLMTQAPIQIGISPVNWSVFKRQFDTGKIPPFFARIVRDTPASVVAVKPLETQAPDLLGRLQEAPPHKRRTTLLTHIQTQASKVLGLDPQEVGERIPLSEMGLDSLMAVELRNLLGSSLNLKRPLPATLVFDYPTIETITDYLVREVLELEINGHGQQPANKSVTIAPSNTQDKSDFLEAIEELSDDEVDRLFAQQMEQLNSEGDGNE